MTDRIEQRIDIPSLATGCNSLSASLWAHENFSIHRQNNANPSCLPGLDLIASADAGPERQLIADAAENQRNKTNDTAPAVWYHQPIEAAQNILNRIDTADKHHKLSPYSLEASPVGFPKCNIFLYDVMDKAGVPLPHAEHGRRLTAAQLNHALARDSNFEKVWQRNSNESRWNTERDRIQNNYRAQDGDIAIWDNRYLEHTCLMEETIDGTGNTYYAGRDTRSGLGHFPFKQWWVESATPGYGAPDAIYRYRHFAR